MTRGQTRGGRQPCSCSHIFELAKLALPLAMRFFSHSCDKRAFDYVTALDAKLKSPAEHPIHSSMTYMTHCRMRSAQVATFSNHTLERALLEK
jgi:hypothetical protein